MPYKGFDSTAPFEQSLRAMPSRYRHEIDHPGPVISFWGPYEGDWLEAPEHHWTRLIP